MNYYLCIGLGVFLTIRALGLADPTYEPGFFYTIASFISCLFLWPVELVLQVVKSLQTRKIYQAMYESLSADALNASVLKELELGDTTLAEIEEKENTEENRNERSN